MFEELQEVWRVYRSWKHVIALRADTYVSEVQPSIKTRHVSTGVAPTSAEKALIAGPVLTKILLNTTDYVYSATDELQELLQASLGRSVEEKLRDLYPELTEIARWRDGSKIIA